MKKLQIAVGVGALVALVASAENFYIKNGATDWTSADSFTAFLNQEYGCRAFAPYSGTCFDLLRGDFIRVTQGKPIESPAAPSGKAARLYAELMASAERLMKAARALEGHPNKELQRFTKEISALAERMEN